METTTTTLSFSGVEKKASFYMASRTPLDARIIVNLHTDLDKLVAQLMAYEGMIVYVTEKKKHYAYTNGTWKPADLGTIGEDVLDSETNLPADTDWVESSTNRVLTLTERINKLKNKFFTKEELFTVDSSTNKVTAVTDLFKSAVQLAAPSANITWEPISDSSEE